MVRLLRLTLLFVLTGLLGIGVAFGLSLLVGLLLPSLKIPVFLIVSVCWLWIGWKYASAMDRS